MEILVCNKCFASLHRGKKPFHLTQCGHVYCHGCIQQAEKQCLQCQQTGILSIELQEPSLSKVASLFIPLKESLASLQKVHGFQNNQMEIMVKRFLEVDKKYETLKFQYYNTTKQIKLMSEKYVKLKVENERLKKQIMSFNMHNPATSSASSASTPFNSISEGGDRYIPSSYFSRPRSYKPNIVTPEECFNVNKRHIMLEGFRVPNSKPSKSAGSCTASDSSSMYTYRR